jgi:hypothetical protein
MGGKDMGDLHQQILFHSTEVTDGSGCPGGIHCPGHLPGYLANNPDTAIARTAALEFLDQCGLVPTPDAIDQLTEVFLPCLAIICNRGYEPNGKLWREGGWRSLLVDIRKKFSRLWRHGWIEAKFIPDHSLDLINYTGFYYRQKHKGEPWGDWGEPGRNR